MPVHTPLDSEQQREFSALLGKILRDEALRLHTARIVPTVASGIPNAQVAPEDYRMHLIAALERQELRDLFIDALLPLDEARRWRAELLKFRSPRDAAAGDDCPYPGLAAYRPGDHARFFGRRAESGELFALLGEGRWLWVEGASGAGKSSLVAAGLLPLLERGGARWKVVGMRPGAHPLDNLARALFELDSRGSLASLTNDLSVGTAGLRAFVREHTPAGERFLLWVDQLEESQTFADAEQAQQFDRLVAAALDDEEPRFQLVTTIRVDQIGGFLAGMRELGRRLNQSWVKRYAVRPLDVEAFDEVIAGPAATCGRRFQDGLVATIRRDAVASFAQSTEGGLPLLAHALRELWLECAGAPELNAAAYDRLGGLAGALTRSAEEALVQLERRDPSARERVRGLLRALATVDRQGRWSRKTITREQALAAIGGAEPDELLACLSGQSVASERPPMRFVTTSSHNDEARVDLIHETLLTSWPTLRQWLAEVEQAKLASAALHEAAGQWREAKYEREALPGGSLRDRFLAAAPDVEPELDRKFQAALRADAAAEAEARRLAEEQERKRRLLAYVAIAALSLLSLGLIVAVVLAVRGQREAESATLAAMAATAQSQQATVLAMAATKDANNQRDRANRSAEDLKRTYGTLDSLLGKNLEYVVALTARLDDQEGLCSDEARADLTRLLTALLRDTNGALTALQKARPDDEATVESPEPTEPVPPPSTGPAGVVGEREEKKKTPTGGSSTKKSPGDSTSPATTTTVAEATPTETTSGSTITPGSQPGVDNPTPQVDARTIDCEDKIAAAEKAADSGGRISYLKEALDCNKRLYAMVQPELRSKANDNAKRIVLVLEKIDDPAHAPREVLKLVKQVEKFDLDPAQVGSLNLIRARELSALKKLDPKLDVTKLHREFDPQVRPLPGVQRELPGAR